MASAPPPEPRNGNAVQNFRDRLRAEAPIVDERDVVVDREAVRNRRRGNQQYPAIMAALQGLRENPRPENPPVNGSSRRRKTKKSKRHVRKSRTSKKRRV